MLRSMNSAVSGLRAHQVKMDVIGNNIANVNTVGYKAQRVTFNEVFSQTLQGGTGASDETGRGGRNPMQVGLGVNVSSIDMLMTQGAAQRTDNPFDLMISGDGFIAVNDASGQYFTRAGALRLDEAGNLVIPNGMKVQGWPANEDGTDIIRGQVEDIRLGDPKFTNTPPSATTTATLSGNLNINDSPISTQIKIYDSLGNRYSMNLQLVYDETTTEWMVETPLKPIADSTTTPPTPPGIDDPGTHIILTDENGNKVAIDATTVNVTGSFKFDTSGNLDKEFATSIKIDGLDLANGVDPETGNDSPIISSMITNSLTVDVSGFTQYSSKTKVDSKNKDGGPAGQMEGYDVGADGKITAYYNNGDIRVLAQIVVAEFDNPAGLQKAGDNLFTVTSNSGEFDSIGKVGNFQAGVLELSNVDLSQEFTDMIVTQRGFQANSRIISVSDEMLQELVNIKR